MLAASAFALSSCAQNTAVPTANAQNANPQPAKKPNIILIVSDDQGYADAGFMGSKDLKTPQLDALAASGTVCTSAYVTFAVCSPSRAGFVSGRHGARMGYDTNADGDNRKNPAIGLPLSERTIGDAMKDAGYTTGIIGKWHLGSQDYFHPNERGFDEFYGFLRGGHSYWNWEPTTDKDRVERENSQWGDYQAPMMRQKKFEPGAEKRYLTDVLSDEAVSYVERNHAKPFFLYLAYNAPHTPMEASPEYLARVSKDLKGTRKTYAAMVLAMDDGIGKLRAKLQELNLSDNTLIYFVSDNGGATNQNAADNGPLRGQKGQVWEGGVRVPMIVSWPGQIPSGAKYDKPVSTLDFVPTSLGATGVDTTGTPGIEGVNLLSYLKGENKGAPHEKLFWRQYDNLWAIREGDWKMVQDKDGKRYLFDLSKDIGEKDDVMKANPEVARRLLANWREWNSTNAALIPWWRQKGIVASAPMQDD